MLLRISPTVAGCDWKNPHWPGTSAAQSSSVAVNVVLGAVTGAVPDESSAVPFEHPATTATSGAASSLILRTCPRVTSAILVHSARRSCRPGHIGSYALMCNHSRAMVTPCRADWLAPTSTSCRSAGTSTAPDLHAGESTHKIVSCSSTLPAASCAASDSQISDIDSTACSKTSRSAASAITAVSFQVRSLAAAARRSAFQSMVTSAECLCFALSSTAPSGSSVRASIDGPVGAETQRVTREPAQAESCSVALAPPEIDLDEPNGRHDRDANDELCF